mgnify:CR=1 FL=1
MPYTKNFYIYALFAVLIIYTAYPFLWTRYGLGVTTIVQYMLLGLVLLGLLLYVAKPPKYKNSWINWLLFIWITQALAFYIGNSSATTQFKESTFVLLTAAPILSLQYNPKHIRLLLIVMALVSVAMYFVTMSMMRLADENSYGGGYQILVALPVLLYFFRNKSLRTQLTVTVVLFTLVLMSMKRSDIIACILVILVYYYVKLKSLSKMDYRIILVIIITAIIGYVVFRYLLANNEIFAWRFEQTINGDSSDRDNIYSNLWNSFINAPLNIQLFGGGFDATLKIGEARAHSDILEVLSCEGIVGLTFYLSAFISLCKQMCQRIDISEKAALASILTIWLVKMTFSMFIYSQPTIILFVLTGYILNNRISRQYEY